MGVARQRVAAALKKFQNKPSVQIGTLGNTAGVVDVPGRPNNVYVTIPGSGTLIVYNERVASVPGMPVEIGRDPLEPDQYQVINVHRYPSPDSSNPVASGGMPGLHASTHNWAGSDPVYIEKRQLMPLRASAVGDMNVFVTREQTYYDGDWQFISGTNLDMSGYAPTTGSLYALIYKDVDEQIKVRITGSVLRDTDTLTLHDAPQPYPGTVPLALVRMYGGQSGIYDSSVITDIVDVRQLFSPILLSGTSSGGGIVLPSPPDANVFYNGSGTFTTPAGGGVILPDPPDPSVFYNGAGEWITPEGTSVNGWTGITGSLTYASADDPTYTLTIPGDFTDTYSSGMRLKLTQTTIKYFVVTKVDYSFPDTTLTLYGGTDYDLTNDPILSPSYSIQKAPIGFPLSPVKWTVKFSDTTSPYISSPTAHAFYNPSGFSLDIPIGAWDVDYSFLCQVYTGGSAGQAEFHGGLSTSDSAQTDPELSMRSNMQNVRVNEITCYRRKIIELTTKTTYYLLIGGIAGCASLQIVGSEIASVIQAICAYL